MAFLARVYATFHQVHEDEDEDDRQARGANVQPPSRRSARDGGSVS